ncbi:hypothetical protein PTSG_03478 [Salpingoeca rosetta]|uniref:Nuclear envelope membrane protein n=1 Tax=Salpingoeca rosetta (strain ATCC 50818 / BSB-021) TaxID=946362 RepID=F2U5Q5_SALR5|nr:uncharacterized protein PTSG_03478 [Salpingoeca rosetta]EGD82846.1 hypothetical protein PTSG_03478 [Salpingoeca rosetta]|eukprot:XP_004995210.1 hypothetical protein PTSG_03478 [Salpingoeca rosetta]
MARSTGSSSRDSGNSGVGVGARVGGLLNLLLCGLGAVATLATLLVLTLHVLEAPPAVSVVGSPDDLAQAWSAEATKNSTSTSTTARITNRVLSVLAAFTQLPNTFPAKARFLHADSVSDTLFHDGILLACFCVVHSLLAHRELKQLLHRWHRPLYILVSCFAMQVVYQRWMIGPEMVTVTVVSAKTLFWIRVAALSSLASIILCDDTMDLFGLRQALLNLRNRPVYRKAKALQDLDISIRHRPFLSVLCLLLAYPAITADQLCLAVTFVVYAALGFRVTEANADYVGERLAAKFKRARAVAGL